jgi:glycosyltransferase involved in cell wall biosynthesis
MTRISLDVRLAGYPGIGRFITGLWTALVHADVDVTALATTHRGESWLGAAELPRPAEPVVTRARPYWPMEQLALPRLLRRLRVDVHHSPHLVVPYLWRGPVVLTVHDLFLFKDPSKARSSASGTYHRLVVPRAVARATTVVAGCEWTARELREVLDVDPAKLRVVEYGLDHTHFRPRGDPEVSAVRHRHGIDGPYLLYVGTAKPHKNLATLLRAHATAPRLPRLVIAGASEGEVRTCDPDADLAAVNVLGRVADDDLPALYSGATAVVLPSLYESLGFSAIEAMACGAPVAASSGGGLPDTVGPAGILVDPLDVAGWRQAMEDLTEDEARRRALIDAGTARAATRSWAAAARSYREIYEDALT